MALPVLPTTADPRSNATTTNVLIREYNRVDRKAPIIGTDAGSSTAYVIDPAPGIALYEVGQTFSFIAANANTTTTPTLNVNGKGAGVITYPDGSPLAVGDIAAGATVTVSVATTAPTFHLLAGGLPGIPQSILTTRGQIIRRGASAPEALNLGAAGTLLISDGTDPNWSALSTLANSLAANVLLNNTTLYFDGPSVAQGTAGKWSVSGTVTVIDSGGSANFDAKLWDGTTVIASCRASTPGAAASQSISLSGVITNPAGNLRISVKDVTSVNGVMQFNTTGNSADSTVTAVRIG